MAGIKHCFIDFFFGNAWIVNGWKDFPTWVLAEAERITHSDTLYWLDISVLFLWIILWIIAVSDFRPLEIYKSLDLPLSTITFTVNSDAGNNFCKCIYLIQILYSMKSVFLLKYMLRFRPGFFILTFELNVKHHHNFF